MTNLEAARKVQQEVERKLPFHAIKLIKEEGLGAFWLPLLVALDSGLVRPGNIPWDERDDRGRFLPKPNRYRL